MENYLFQIKDDVRDDRVFVLIIYDISNNRRRVKLARFLQGFGFRVQKSAFEALIKENVYHKMMAGIGNYIEDEEDTIRVYKIIGKGQVKTFGKKVDYSVEDTIII